MRQLLILADDLSGAANPALTRAGSFGKPEALLHCPDFLDNLKRSAGVVRQQASHL
jgi:hypothetical protein